MKINLPKSHFFKSSLARASGLVLMSDPGMSIVWIMILNLPLGPVDDAVNRVCITESAFLNETID